MVSFVPHIVEGEHWLLTAQRAVYWEEENALVIADLHFGKSGHFRKSGIAIPQNIIHNDMQRLLALIQYFKPGYLLIVGDMFHSYNNKEKDFFDRWRNDIVNIPIHLVKGNHDVLNAAEYYSSHITVHEQSLTIRSIHFVHDATDKPKTGYCVSGHIHPAILMRGSGKQSMKFPCYYFSKDYAILPAFGKFTGNHILQPFQEDAVYIISNNNVVRV